jgi:hypothetical protein
VITIVDRWFGFKYLPPLVLAYGITKISDVERDNQKSKGKKGISLRSKPIIEITNSPAPTAGISATNQANSMYQIAPSPFLYKKCEPHIMST